MPASVSKNALVLPSVEENDKDDKASRRKSAKLDKEKGASSSSSLFGSKKK